MHKITLQKTNTTQIQIQESEFQGQTYIDIRIYYLDKESGEFRPSKKGVSLRPEHWSDFLKELKAQNLI